MLKKITLLLSIQFVMINYLNSQELVPYCKNGVYGYSDLKGKMKVEPQFSRAKLFINGIAIVSKKGLDYLINTKGKLITQNGYDNLEDTEWGYYVAEKGDSCGLIDGTGKVKIPIIYSRIDGEKSTLLLRKQDDTYLILNSELKEILFSSGKVSINSNRREVLYSADYSEQRNGKEMERSVVLNGKGNIVFGPVNGKISLELDHEPLNYYRIYIKNSADSTEFEGLLNEEGKVIVPPKFDKVSNNFEPLSYSLSKEIEKFRKEPNEEKMMKFIRSDKMQSNLCFTCASGSKKYLYNLKGEEVPPMLKLDLNGGTILISYEEISDSFDNQKTLINLFNSKGEKITKKDLIAIHKNEDFIDMGLIVCTYDSLWGAFKMDGSEYLPFIYKKIELDKNNMIGLKSPGGKTALIRYPAAPPQPIDGKGWYTELRQANAFGLIKTTLEGDAVRYGLLDSTGKELLTPVYQNLNLLDDAAFIEEDGKNKFILTSSGKKISVPDNTKLLISFNSAKEQFLFKNNTELYLQNGKSKKTLFTFADSMSYNIDLHNQLKDKGIWYFSILKDLDEAIYQFENGKVKQLHDFGKVDFDRSQSTYAISYMKADSTCNFVTLKGKEVVPYGNWSYLQDLMGSTYQPYNEKNNYFFVNTTKDASVFNNEGKKIYDCKNCILDPAESPWDLYDYLLYVNPVNTNAKTFNLLYDMKTMKFLDIPFEGDAEQLNDTLYLLKDTLRNSYLYYWTQNLLKKLPFKCIFTSSFGEEFQTYQLQDENNNRYFLNNKTLETVQIPGTMIDYTSFFNIYDPKNPRDFFYFTKEINGTTKKGVVTETGKVLIDAKYDQIDVFTEYDDRPFFICKNGEYTDMINMKGELVSPQNKKYSNFYYHDETILVASREENGVVFSDMYNSYDNFKKVNYSIKMEGIEPLMIQINGKNIIRYSKTMMETKKDENETYEEENEFTLYVNEDGTRYFEFDSKFKDPQ